MARKRLIPVDESRVVDFDFNDLTYQIDTQRQKVYRRFVEIETSRAMEIYSNWRAQTVQA